MDSVLCLWEATYFQSMELERPELYAVSNQAHDRGYGPPEEIVPVDKKSRFRVKIGRDRDCQARTNSVQYFLGSTYLIAFSIADLLYPRFLARR